MGKIDLKKEGIKILGGLGYVLVIYLIIYFFHPHIIILYLILLTSSTVMLLASKKFKLKSWFIMGIQMAGVFTAIYFLSLYVGGLVGFSITVSLISALILYKRRKKYIEIKRHIEAMIWGKPLNEFIKAGEKPHKVKIKF